MGQPWSDVGLYEQHRFAAQIAGDHDGFPGQSLRMEHRQNMPRAASKSN